MRDSPIAGNRRARLAALIASYETRARFAEKFDISEAYLWQLINGAASFGEKAARKLEQKIGLDAGYFDRETDASTALHYDAAATPPTAVKLAERILTSARAGHLPEAKIKVMIDLLDALTMQSQ